jgi:hypothetical protein
MCVIMAAAMYWEITLRLNPEQKKLPPLTEEE